MQLDLTAFIVPAVGSSVALMAGVLVYLWKRRCDRHTRELQAMEPRIVDIEAIKIQGIVIGVLRSYTN